MARDRKRIEHDHRELRHYLREGNYSAAEQERAELRAPYRDRTAILAMYGATSATSTGTVIELP